MGGSLETALRNYSRLLMRHSHNRNKCSDKRIQQIFYNKEILVMKISQFILQAMLRMADF
jgi:hypothetical protein